MSYASEVIALSPAGYWPCREASGNIQDSSGNANHATSTGGSGSATYSETGPIVSDGAASKSIKFSAFYFDIPDHVTLDLGDVWTCLAWIKRNSIGANHNIVNKQGGAYSFLVAANNTLQIHRKDTQVLAETTPTITADSTFHMVAGTKNGATRKLYIDNVESTNLFTDSTCTDNTLSLRVGAYFGGGEEFDGWIAEVAVFPTALSAANITTLWSAAFAIEPSGPVFKRFFGPALLTASAADLYTVPAGKRIRILDTHVSNPSAGAVDLTLSIGTDAAGTRVYDGLSIPADSRKDDFTPYDLAAGEKIQGFASSAATLNLTISGYEEDE